MGAIRKHSADQFDVDFAALAKSRRGEPVQVDPFLIGRAIALVMRECTVRSAAGKPILWNEYRMILARKDFELVRSLQGTLERDLQDVLQREAAARQADLVGALRVTVVFDEADELASGSGVVRVAFASTDRSLEPRAGEMTVRFDGFAMGGQIVGKPLSHDTVFVDDSTGGDRIHVWWPGGEKVLAVGVTAIVGRPHPDAPAGFVALTGAGAKVNKQHVWIAVGPTSVRIGRYATANPVHVNGQSVAASQNVEVPLPAEVSLSHGDLVFTIRRS